MQDLFSDVTFIVEGTLVKAHKIVLCQRCDIMSAMLRGGFRESQANEVRAAAAERFSLQAHC